MGAFIIVAVILLATYEKKRPVLPPEPAPTPSPVAAAPEPAVTLTEYEQATKQLEQARQEIDQLRKQAEAARIEAEKFRQSAFLGITTQCKSFVFLIDMSGSMEKYDALMARTVAEVLEPMDDAFRCQIVGFQGNEPGVLHLWQPRGSLSEMDPPGKAQAAQFVDNLRGQFDGGTPTYYALMHALEYDAEAIFLLSDGAPTDVEPADIIRQVTAANRGRKKIYCVALGAYNELPDLVVFLDLLASQNGGMFLGVSE